jgi:hypothetical protein
MKMSHDTVRCLLTPQRISDLIGISRQRLGDWREADVGFPYYKTGNEEKSGVRYNPKEVADYMVKNVIYPSNEASAVAGKRPTLKRPRFSSEQIEKLLEAEKDAPEFAIPEGRRLLIDVELSEWIGVPARTLANWRSLGKGPAFIKIGTGRGGKVRYDPKDIQEYIAENRRLPISQRIAEGPIPRRVRPRAAPKAVRDAFVAEVRRDMAQMEKEKALKARGRARRSEPT